MLKLYKKLGDDITIESVIDDYSGMRIIITDSNSESSQIFLDSYVAYRNSDESYRLKFLSENNELCGSNSMYSLEKSEYLDWVVSQSQNTIDTNNLKHFIIISSNDILDILSFDNPIITSVDLKKKIQVVID